MRTCRAQLIRMSPVEAEGGSVVVLLRLSYYEQVTFCRLFNSVLFASLGFLLRFHCLKMALSVVLTSYLVSSGQGSCPVSDTGSTR